MSPTHASASPQHDELTAMIRQVRRRWRLRVALRGLAIVVAVVLAVLLVSTYGMDRVRFSEGSIVAARIAVFVALVAAAVRWLVLPAARRVSDERVALYVEEHEPSLQASLLSAVEARATGRPGADAASPALTRRLVQQAVERARAVEFGARVDREAIRRGGAMAAASVVAAVALVALGPAFVRSGARLVFWPFQPAAAAVPVLAVAVTPGDATVARGGDLAIQATLQNFTADGAELRIRRGTSTTWETVPMTGSTRAAYSARIFDIDSTAEYLVESEGVRSPVFTIRVVDRPFVKTLALEYRFPAYTGLPVQTVEDGGDIAAPRGTVVRVRATPTQPVRGGRLVVEGGPAIPLALDSAGALVGDLRVEKPGFYRVELVGTDGQTVPGSLDYVIDVLPDRAPTVSIEEPGRDTKVTSLEEVFASVEAHDDYGVASVELVYAVNGGPEKTVPLHGGGGRRTPDVTAGHTFFMEEFGLKPGDVVSYYARARDNNAAGAQTAASDIYFLEVRPFDRAYRQAEQQGGGGGGGGQQEASPSELSARQREIVSATFKQVRDKAQISEKQRREDLTTLALAQTRLREQVEGLIQRVRQRGGALAGDSAAQAALREIAEALPLAAQAMKEAEDQLGRRAAEGALPPEQRALQQLQRAEAAFREVEVSFGGQQGGGGGGGQQRDQDLSDLFGLDVDKLRNQYETVQRGGQQQQQEQANAEVDKTLERLRELAARQQRESERMRREADALRQRAGQSGGASGGGGGQRQLAQEAEEMARQLERLSREQQSPELQQSARQLQEAADAMRRAAAAGGDQAAASAAAARDRLEAARRQLEQNRSARSERDTRDLQRRAQALVEEQRRVGAAAEQLAGGQGRGTEAERQVLERKDSLAAGVSALERDLDRAARDARREQPEAARRLQEAANTIRDTRVLDKLRFSKSATRGLSPEYARNLEEQIASNLDDVRERVDAAAAAVREPDGRRASQSVERARELAQAMESLAERTRQRREDTTRAGGGQSGAQQGGQQGNQQGGRQGAQGQRGQQGQAGGQQGQRGQQGQAGGQQGEGGQQQGQGQQGQGQQGQGQQGQGGQHGQQGQGQGQDGQQGQGGQQGGGRQGAQRGGMTVGGAPMGPGGGGESRPGGFGRRFTAEEARQLGRETQQRRSDAEELRRALAQQGIDTRDLDGIIARMRQLENQGAYSDAENIERLQADVVEGLKAFEFALRRRIEGPQGEQLRLGGSEEVPPEFKALVEEYYRSLARPRR